MAVVYILRSEQLQRFYIGSTAELSSRIEQHITSHYPNSYTAKATDWKLFLSIENLDYEQARKIEKHIKKMRNVAYYNNLIKFPEIIEKLRVKFK